MKKPVVVDDQTLRQAADMLRAGGVVAFPTETYYGLAVDPFNERAVARLYEVKQRPHQRPILVLVRYPEDLSKLVTDIPPLYGDLMQSFWPGPLTLVFPANAHCSPLLTGGTGTVGVRQSPHPVARRLLEVFGGPITATSANLSGQPAATTAQQAAQFFGDQVDLVLDGGVTPGGCGSTLVGIRGDTLYCVRPGKVDFSRIKQLEEKI